MTDYILTFFFCNMSSFSRHLVWWCVYGSLFYTYIAKRVLMYVTFSDILPVFSISYEKRSMSLALFLTLR